MAEEGDRPQRAPAGRSSVELPSRVIEEVERLTRLIRRESDKQSRGYRKRRKRLLVEYGYEARVREETEGDVLVCYPAEWLSDGEVVLDRIEDRARAIERPLEGSDEEWAVVERANQEIVTQVREDYGSVHAANVRALADFLGNHHVVPISGATEAHLREFRTEYYPRNAWPSDDQRAVLDQSLRITFEVAGVENPPLA